MSDLDRPDNLIVIDVNVILQNNNNNNNNNHGLIYKFYCSLYYMFRLSMSNFVRFGDVGN